VLELLLLELALIVVVELGEALRASAGLSWAIEALLMMMLLLLLLLLWIRVLLLGVVRRIRIGLLVETFELRHLAGKARIVLCTNTERESPPTRRGRLRSAT